MNKRDLRKIPDPEISLENFNSVKWNFYLYLTEVTGEEVLVIYIFNVIGSSPKFKVFIWKDSYTSLKKEGENYVWTEASVAHLVDSNYNGWLGCYDGKSIQILNSESIEQVNTFFETRGEDTYRNIDHFQEKIREKRLEIRDLKTTERIDKAMDKVLEPPENFDTWVENEVLYNSRYVIYEYSKKKIINGFCTHCRNEVEVNKDKCRHNVRGICPSCKSEVTFKAKGKMAAVTEDYKNAAILQSYENGFILRYLLVKSRIYKDKIDKKEDYKKLYIGEMARDIYPDANEFKVREFEYTLFKQRMTRWCDSAGKYNCGNAVLYPYNIKEVLKDTDYKYSALEQMAVYKHAYNFNIKEFMKQYIGCKHYEYLIKMGLCNIVKGIINLSYNQHQKIMNKQGKGITEVLGIEKYDIPILQSTQADLTGLEYVRYARKHGIKLQEEHIQFIQENYRSSLSDITDFCSYTTIGKAIKYIKDKGRVHSRSGYRKRSELWQDYINMAKQLKYDLRNEFVLFPTDIEQAHDIAVNIINEKNNKERYQKENKKNAKIAKMENEINKEYYFENKEYFIRAPHNAAEIVKEGQTLHHCVAGYTDRVAAGRTTILFLRKKETPDISYYTIEINNRKITQWHGKYNDINNPKPRKVVEFVKKFEKERVSQKKERITA